MKTFDLKVEKLEIINWIYRLKDTSLIEELKLFKTKNQSEETEIPEWQKDLVRNRIKNTKKEDYITWDELESQLKLE